MLLDWDVKLEVSAMMHAVLASLLVAAAAPTPVIVEAGAKTTLGRRLCTVSGDPRVTLVDGKLIVPEPAAFARLTVAAGDCSAAELLSLSVVPVVPRDATVAWLYPDESRLELRGGSLARDVVWWRVGPGPFKSGVCTDVAAGADGVATCSLAMEAEDAQVALGGATVEVLRLPPGSPSPSGAAPPEIWSSAEAKDSGPVSSDAFRVALQRVVLSGPLLHATSLEAWREQSTLPLAAPGIVASVRCRSTGCWLSDDHAGLVVVPPATGDSVAVSVGLREHVYVRQGDSLVNSVNLTLPVARCKVRPLIGMVLGGTDDHRLPLALGDRCPSELNGLAVETTPPSAAYVESVSSDGKQVVVRLGHVPGRADALEVRLLRAATHTTVGSARVDIRSNFAPVRIAMLDSQLGDVPFIPVNREVKLQWTVPDTKVGPLIVPVSLPGYYSVRLQGNDHLVRGGAQTLGSVPVRFAYQLEGSSEPLVVFDSDMRFPIKNVNVPISLAAEDSKTGKLFTVLCRGAAKGGEKPGEKAASEQEMSPGDSIPMPFSARGSCRLRIDRNVLSPTDGTQRVKLSVKIASPTGTSRSGGFSQVLVLSAGTLVDSVSLGTNEAMHAFDHLLVTLSHDDQPNHYLGTDDASSLPSRHYQLVFGDARLRLYGSATVPTGLYRITRASDGGLLQFSAGALVRLAILDREGRELPVDFEFALLGTNLSGRADLSIVAGTGITVPLLNAQESTQAAIGIHAWVEYSPTRSSNPARPFALVFGPSISIGDFGINL